MQNEDGYTLLAFATHHGYFNIVDVLLRAGANPNIPTSDFKGSNTPLHIAANYGFKKI
jgi:ankyrin repeat protein